MPVQTDRLPVTVVTGFLGSGKTTLLRHLLLHGQQRLAVLVNEFGEVGLDGALLRSCGFCPEEEVNGRLVELANGCLCCTVQDDFLPSMEMLLQRADQIDGILIETSGLALPAPLLSAFSWPEIRSRIRVNGVVTVVNGEALAAGAVVADPAALEAQREADPSLDHAAAIDDLFDDQLACADLVLVSRAECLKEGDLQRVQERLRPTLRDGTPVIPIARGEISPDLVLGLNGQHDPHTAEQEDHDHHDHSHVAMESVVVELAGGVNRQRLEDTLRHLVRQPGLVRVKGRLWLPGKARPLELQAVGPRLETWFAATGASFSPEQGGLKLVFLGFQLCEEEIHKAVEASVEP